MIQRYIFHNLRLLTFKKQLLLLLNNKTNNKYKYNNKIILILILTYIFMIPRLNILLKMINNKILLKLFLILLLLVLKYLHLLFLLILHKLKQGRNKKFKVSLEEKRKTNTLMPINLKTYLIREKSYLLLIINKFVNFLIYICQNNN